MCIHVILMYFTTPLRCHFVLVLQFLVTFSPRAQERSFLFTRLSFLLSNCLADSFDVAPFEYNNTSLVVSCSVLPFRLSLVCDLEYFTITFMSRAWWPWARVAFVVSVSTFRVLLYPFFLSFRVHWQYSLKNTDSTRVSCI
jgi:hypothetical protein